MKNKKIRGWIILILIVIAGIIALKVKREHAFLLLKGDKLPFQPKGKVFYFKEEKC